MPNLHLTQMFDPEVEHGYRNTLPGMAFWAGSGPIGLTCVDCEHLDLPKDSKKEKALCREFKRLARVQGRKFSKHSAACKYFEARPI